MIGIQGVSVNKLSIVHTPGGDVMHGVKSSDEGFEGFGEAYFSLVDYKRIKGWKRHKEMTLNLVVPCGAVRFVIYDDRTNSRSHEKYEEITLSNDNYNRLTIPPMLWLGFQGMSRGKNIVLNVASIPHSPEEADKKGIEELNFSW